jgi:ethanolamine utilization microcompartment shell protein EutL
MTKTELLSDLEGQVIKILAENPVGQAAGGIQPIEVVCLVTGNAVGDVNRRVQIIYLDTETGACYYGENRVRNYAARPPNNPRMISCLTLWS